jgi:hypothetical protein
MGNSQSQAKDKTTQLWSHWTPKEQEQLKQQYDSPAPLPNYFSNELSTSFKALLRSNDLPHYLEVAYQLVKTKDSQYVYLVFQQSIQQNQISLKSFVKWVVESTVPIWFENGSSYRWTSHGDAHLLIDHLLYHAKEKERQQKESMSWLNEEATTTVVVEGETWETKAMASPSQITESEFLAWIGSTPGFLSLFQIAAEFIVLSKFGNDQMHKRRLEHMASPSIQKHNKETCKLFGQDQFSSLMTPYDYFMLSLNLPSNALSWSEYEKTQRKVQDDDLEHSLLFSSRRDGTSWQVFVGKMVGQGATLVVIKAKDGSVFGGYLDEASYCNTDWYGNSANFLFRLRDKYGAWDGNGGGGNDHFQYLCWGKKSLPNGFGMGGQFDYAGLWMDADFIHGHSKAGPLCTTYSSPQLSADQTFIVDEVEGNLFIIE